MTTIATNETLYQLRCGEQETGPFTIGQLRSMWLSGAITADTTYRFDASSDWQPLTLLRRLLEPASATTPSSPLPSDQATPDLILPIVSLVLAFIPVLCIAGIICGHITLARPRTSNDSTVRTIAVIALVIGYVSLVKWAFFALTVFSKLSEPPQIPPIIIP